MQCFWDRGYTATSVQDLIGRTGLTAASLYNAYGDKRAMFRTALGHYVDGGVHERMLRCETLPPRQAIETFFDEVLSRSLRDREHKGCMLVNSAVELAPHDPEFRKIIVGVLAHMEDFFRTCIAKGQADGTISRVLPAEILARHLLGVLMGVRVLARVRPERKLLEGVLGPALSLLDPSAPRP